MREHLVMENDRLRLQLDTATLSVTIEDKSFAGGEMWRSKGLIELQYGEYVFNLAEHCRVKIKAGKKIINLAFSNMDYYARFKGHYYKKPENGPDIRLHASIILNSDNIEFKVDEIENLDEEGCVISFPDGLMDFNSGSQTRIVFPSGYGMMYEFPREDFFMFNQEYGTFSFNMPICGIFRKTSALCAYLKDPFDCSAKIHINSLKKGVSGVKFSFVYDRLMANYPRSITFYPLGKAANHVTLAKHFRKILKEEKRFVSLEEKIRANPEVEKLVGAVIWKHDTFSQTPPSGTGKSYSLYMLHPEQNIYEGMPAKWSARELFETAHDRGFDRVCVFNTGWNYGGYDSHFPKRFPPNKERGTERDFKRDADYARTLSDGFIYSVHDNYTDAYENSPQFKKEYLVKDKHGIPLVGGIWRGGRAYRMCLTRSMDFAKRDIPRLRKMLGRGSIYVDVLGCVSFKCCYDRRHPMTRREDASARKDLLRYVKSQMGSIATEAAPADHLNDIVDLGAFCYIHNPWTFNPTTNPLPVPVPLYQLVYHDSVLNYTSESTYKCYGDEYISYVALYGLLPTQIDEVGKNLSFILRDTYKSEMTNHEFLEKLTVRQDDDGIFWSDGVAKTSFSDGTSIIANFKTVPFLYQQHNIPPRSVIILDQDSNPKWLLNTKL